MKIGVRTRNEERRHDGKPPAQGDGDAVGIADSRVERLVRRRCGLVARSDEELDGGYHPMTYSCPNGERILPAAPQVLQYPAYARCSARCVGAIGVDDALIILLIEHHALRL